MSSEYILLLLTCEVYMAIVYPVRHINTITTARLMVAVGVIWLCSAIFTLSYNMATCQIVNGVCFVGRAWVTPAAQPAYFTINFFIKLFFPLSVFAFCYTGMAVSLRTNKVDTSLNVCLTLFYAFSDFSPSLFTALTFYT